MSIHLSLGDSMGEQLHEMTNTLSHGIAHMSLEADAGPNIKEFEMTVNSCSNESSDTKTEASNKGEQDDNDCDADNEQSDSEDDISDLEISFINSNEAKYAFSARRTHLSSRADRTSLRAAQKSLKYSPGYAFRMLSVTGQLKMQTKTKLDKASRFSPYNRAKLNPEYAAHPRRKERSNSKAIRNGDKYHGFSGYGQSSRMSISRAEKSQLHDDEDNDMMQLDDDC